jgi:histidine phosphotransfer protein HptB
MNPQPVFPDEPPEPLDPQALARLRDLDPDGRMGVLQRVLEAFDNSLARMITQLESQREQGDPTVVGSIAHTLKSSSASVGAMPLARLCAEIELQLRGGAPTNLSHDVDRLVQAAARAQRSVGAILRP